MSTYIFSDCQLDKLFKIRAGLLYNLHISNRDKIFSSSIKELIRMNRLSYEIKEFSRYLFIKNYIIPYVSEGYKSNPEIVFPKFAEYFIGKFIALGYTLEEVWSAAYLFLDVYTLHPNNGILVEIIYQDIKQNPGVKIEHPTIQRLSAFGIDVGPAVSKNIIIKTKGIDIELNGKPDGIITKSLGDIYKAGTVVEIKLYKELEKDCSYKNQYQLCAYGLIYNTDVLYVCVDNSMRIKCKLYKLEKLKELWSNIKDTVINNCVYFCNAFKNMTNDENLTELINSLQLR